MVISPNEWSKRQKKLTKGGENSTFFELEKVEKLQRNVFNDRSKTITGYS